MRANPKTHDDYVREIQKMAARARKWRKANPEREVMVQFNFPSEAMVIGTIAQAIEKKYISVNEAGLDLINSLGAPGCINDYSVLMLRIALELPEK